uniref:phosphatidylinositol 5-phosphate 4-kinase type-2 alpha-like isoform X2 n=1 Tax=Myxine glutinosa TaxID=7769 RepID=UPI00358F057A
MANSGSSTHNGAGAAAFGLANNLASKSKKKQFVAQKVKLFRASDPLISVLMWGVNHTINELIHVPQPVMLLPDDFKAYSKIKVNNHLFNKENMPSHFKLKEYCPLVFRNLRERFCIDDSDYQHSMTKHPALELDKALMGTISGWQRSVVHSAPVTNDGQGRSGARFLTTYDQRFVIKTIVSEDVAEMHSILTKYHQYVVECHGNTLLPQFLGMYRLTVDGVETYMVVTHNVFSRRLPVHQKYDLKGSTVDRMASDKEKTKELPTLKDNDFLNDGRKIAIGDVSKKLFLDKLARDVEFLTNLKIMDYSLLVGIHDVDHAAEKEEEKGARADVDKEETDDRMGDLTDDLKQPKEDEEEYREFNAVRISTDETPDEDGSDGEFVIGSLGTSPDTTAFSLFHMKPMEPGEFDPNYDVYAIKSHPSAQCREVYFMAIIDILTHYDTRKKAAHAAKTVKHGAGAEISTVNPEQYGKRFLDFVNEIVM